MLREHSNVWLGLPDLGRLPASVLFIARRESPTSPLSARMTSGYSDCISLHQFVHRCPPVDGAVGARILFLAVNDGDDIHILRGMRERRQNPKQLYDISRNSLLGLYFIKFNLKSGF